MRVQRIIYWIATSLFSLLIGFSLYNYFFNYDTIHGFFLDLGYPTYLIYPIAIAKILGLIIVWTHWGGWIKEWAYAGFFFNALLAFLAHFMISDGQGGGAIMVLVFLLISYFLSKKVRS